MFIGHKSELNGCRWKVLPQFKNTQTFCKDDLGYFMQSNICTHQGSLMCTNVTLHKVTKIKAV